MQCEFMYGLPKSGRRCLNIDCHTHKELCKHRKRKWGCVRCKTDLYCDHGIQRRNCDICNPSINCRHNKRKRTCYECKPHLKCPHSKRKSDCRDCTPSIMCEHNKRTYNCNDCYIMRKQQMQTQPQPQEEYIQLFNGYEIPEELYLLPPILLVNEL